MEKNHEPKPDNPEQSKRFIDTATDLGTDKESDALERAMGVVVPRKEVRKLSAGK